jgi:hypothetical protein
MDRKCVVCHDREARFRCIQCHKPVCDECAFKTDQGAFCSRDCATAYRSFKESYDGPEAGRRSAVGSLLKLLLLLVVLAAAAAALYYLGLIPGIAPGG